MADDLRMIRLRLEAPRLFDLARRRKLPSRVHDPGYVVHCQLKELFGDDAPAPFSVIEGAGRWLTVLAYTKRAAADLVDHARSFADPSAVAACDLSTLVDKVLPVEWPSGKRLGFEVRVCPIVRLSAAVQVPGGPTIREGAEVDAFLARCWKTSGPVEREEVYRDWLAKEIERRGGIKVLSARVKGHTRATVVRRDHASERSAKVSDRPDVTFTGEAEVTDGAAFTALLARGVGRHRAFGFGMLLLRPASTTC